MLMDILFETCGVARKRRVHFHKFCLEIHRRIHEHKMRAMREQDGETNMISSPERDVIRQVAQDIAREATLLCFDEFQITDIADAMIIKKLFTHIWFVTNS